jgi:hypothetical protein
MKKLMPPITLVCVSTLILLLPSGCAMFPDASVERGVDEAKIQAIERAARSRGVTVRWVNYPVK